MTSVIFEIIAFDRSKIDQLYEELITELSVDLPEECEYHHVGSTALLGLETKGDLDICIRIPTTKILLEADMTLARHWQRNDTSVRNEYFSSFWGEREKVSIGFQLVVKNSPLDFFMKFRKILENDIALQLEYNMLKKTYNGRNMDEYREAKTAFIERILSK